MTEMININSKRRKLIVYLLLTIVILAVFWQVTTFDFINLDDTVYVTKNNHILSGFPSKEIRWAFTTTHGELWHPLTWFSLMLDHQLYGLNAGGYHLTSLILHILSSLLLLGLFHRMTGSLWPSAFVAALFALHPLHVESVAWVSKRKDVLSAFFWMLSLYLYVYYTEKQTLRRYLPVLFSFVLAIMSKPIVVTLPVIMILLDYWPLKRFESHKTNLFLWQLKEKAPFFILSVFFSIVAIYAQPILFIKDWPFPLGSRIINALVAFVIYLEKIFWLHNMAVFYPFYGQAPLWQVSGAAALILVVSAAVIIAIKRLPYLFVGWAWYAITLFPVIGIIPIGNKTMSDHYMYLPSIGITIMVAWGIPAFLPREIIRKRILFPAGIAVLIILSILTWRQCSYWKNSVELFRNSSHVTKDNAHAHGYLAYSLAEKGNFKDAINQYNEAIRLWPGNASAYLNRGNAYSELSQIQRAIEDYNEAIRLQPDYAEAYYNRGIMYIESGLYQKAIQDFDEILRLNLDYIPAYYNRALAFSKIGQYSLAIQDYTRIINMKSDDVEAYNNRATIYLNQGNKEPGCRDAQKACELGACRVLEIAKSKGDCH